MSPVDGPNRTVWRGLSVATAAVAAVSLVMSPILYLRTSNALDQIHRNRVELCRQGNERHDQTIRTLNREIRRLPASQRIRAQRNIAGTVALIDALAPKRDCSKSLN